MAEIFNTRTLATAIMGDDLVDANPKAATRTLRKFLRDETSQVDSVGKGGRYTITLNKNELKAMAKRYAAWEVAQEEAKAARAAALEALKKTEAIILPVDDEGTEDIHDAEIIEDDMLAIEGPTDDEIAALLQDDDTDEI